MNTARTSWNLYVSITKDSQTTYKKMSIQHLSMSIRNSLIPLKGISASIMCQAHTQHQHFVTLVTDTHFVAVIRVIVESKNKQQL